MYRLDADQTYSYKGKRWSEEFADENAAVARYHEINRGMVSIVAIHDDGSQRILEHGGRKYIKGSPFYDFPHFHHLSKIDGSEIPTT